MLKTISVWFKECNLTVVIRYTSPYFVSDSEKLVVEYYENCKVVFFLVLVCKA